MNGVEKAVNGVTALGTIIMHIVEFVDVQRAVGVRIGIHFKSRCTVHFFGSEDIKCADVCELVVVSCTHRTVPLTNLVTALSSSF